jgi:hypothetical protein
MLREEVLVILRRDFTTAQTRAEIAGQHFNEIIKEVPSGLPHPDGTQRIRNASAEYATARKTLMLALSRLSDFVAEGTIPDDLKDS